MRALETFNKILAIGMLLLFVGILMLLPGCKVVKHTKTATKDSAAVARLNEGSNKVDSSGSKSDKTNSKETVYYPQPIIVPGKDGADRIIFVPQSVKETGTEKTEDANISKSNQWKDKYDSLMYATLLSNKDSTVKAGPSFIEWILICAVGLIFLKSFAPTIIKLITKT